MKKHLIFVSLVVSIISLIILLGCFTQTTEITSTTTTTTTAGENYFPHADGNTWYYAGTDGNTHTITVDGTAVIGTKVVQVFKTFNTSSTGAGTTSEAYYLVSSSGVYNYGGSGWSTTEAFIYLSFPLAVGKSWTFYNIPPVLATASVEARENLVVPAGTFDCFKIKYTYLYGTDEASSSNVWLGNGAGIVKSTNSSSTVETVLQSKNF